MWVPETLHAVDLSFDVLIHFRTFNFVSINDLNSYFNSCLYMVAHYTINLLVLTGNKN